MITPANNNAANANSTMNSTVVFFELSLQYSAFHTAGDVVPSLKGRRGGDVSLMGLFFDVNCALVGGTGEVLE